MFGHTNKYGINSGAIIFRAGEVDEVEMSCRTRCGPQPRPPQRLNFVLDRGRIRALPGAHMALGLLF